MAKKFTERKVGGFVISNDIPLPGPVNRQNGSWPFSDMEIGESFPLEDENQMLTCRTTASQHAKRHGLRFSIRKTYEIDGPPYRCWRIA